MKKFVHSTWDKRSYRFIPYRKYVFYNDKTNTLYLPRYDFTDFCSLLEENNIKYSIEHIELQQGKKVLIPLKPHIKDRSELQTCAINYLVTSQESLRGLSLSTGVGKTYCSIKTISLIGVRSVIFVSGLVDQWKKEIFNFTELTEDDVYIVQGAASLTKLLLKIDKTLFPKIILFSLGTIRAYALNEKAYENYPPFTELFNILQIGLKIVDEAHLNFFLTLMIDLQTNAAINIPLTATFNRGEYQVKKIFDQHYSKDIRYGEDVFKKYIDIYSYSYSLGGVIPSKAYSTIEGYNHNKLEEWLIRKGKRHLEHIYNKVYSPIIFAHYINYRKIGQKLLILCSSTVMCEWFRDILMKDLPKQENLKIEIYIYETEDIVLSEADIIISTPKSGGTGRDIKDLKTVLMTVATGSDNMNKQSLGRLRELPSGDTPIYMYTWNRDIEPHLKYQEYRKNTYAYRGKEFHEISL